MKSRSLTRRELALSLAVGGLGRVTCAGFDRARAFAGRVGVSALSEAQMAGGAAAAVAQAVQRAVPGSQSAAAAVSALFSADDVVGIKLNCLAGPALSPRPQLVEAFVQLLAAGGVPKRQIIVFERSSRELERAGYRVRREGASHGCYGVDNDFDRSPVVSGEIGSCYARLVSTTCSALVSFGVVKDHDLAGVSAGLKNWYGVIHNPNKYHQNNCDPYVADVVRHPFIRDKLRLTILDGVHAQCQGGPAFHAPGRFELAMVAASTDPVAADVWAWQAIEAERRRRSLPTLESEKRPPRFLATAASYGLGSADAASLQVVGA